MARRKKVVQTKPDPQPWQPPDDTPFPFEKLPAELRNAVYEAYFVRDKPISISRRRCATKKEFTPASLGHYTTPIVTPGDTQLNSGEADTPGLGGGHCVTLLGVNGASVLRASKTIHHEAIPIFYGRNIFTFNSTNATIKFMETIGSMSKHLLHLQLTTWNSQTIEDAFKHFTDVKYLQSIEIMNATTPFAQTPVGFARNVKRGVLAFVRQGDTDLQRRQRLAIIQVRPAKRLSVDNNGIIIMAAKVSTENIREALEILFVKEGVLQPSAPADSSQGTPVT
ncbi:hypothetical protein LTR56_009729 [Elasticomyces elasticus]|nr:hypothetical protein LTR56_009729 [Elasticomyces elasticus]KAK3653546.1 hypothetical protein LTR22_011220 [Elasticomyces elasticus]KAK4919149.1 hypothetical protein LTR49_013153 [Elasticomyces elasticus]KAK5753197.1 hypothetical protein LTS12_016768 [Elasticomyces elasticus]